VMHCQGSGESVLRVVDCWSVVVAFPFGKRIVLGHTGESRMNLADAPDMAARAASPAKRRLKCIMPNGWEPKTQKMRGAARWTEAACSQVDVVGRKHQA
jgi:hypothetical protein